MLLRLGRASVWVPAIFGAFARPAVATASRDVFRWKQKALRREATIARLQAALERADIRYHDLHARLELRRHASLDHDVLRRVLPIRASHPTAAAEDAERAALRDARFQERSSSYRAELCAARASGDCTRIEIDHLPWWVPCDETNQEYVPRAQRQGFPFRAILQTREVAIGGVMLDIGANIGRTSIPRVLLGDARAVYAAEPAPANYACLVRNTTEHNLRGFVLPDRVAIGAARGVGQMRLSRYPGGHRLIPSSETSAGSIDVQVWPLDAWIEHLGIEPDGITFVKVDTQGSEVNVLCGARSLLARRYVSWLIEVDPALLRRAGTQVSELLDLLQRHFTDFIDIGASDAGPRVRRTTSLHDAVAYLGTRQTKTDLLLFHAV